MDARQKCERPFKKSKVFLFHLTLVGQVLLENGAHNGDCVLLLLTSDFSPTFSTGAVKKYFCGEFSSEGESISGQKWL